MEMKHHLPADWRNRKILEVYEIKHLAHGVFCYQMQNSVFDVYRIKRETKGAGFLKRFELHRERVIARQAYLRTVESKVTQLNAIHYLQRNRDKLRSWQPETFLHNEYAFLKDENEAQRICFLLAERFGQSTIYKILSPREKKSYPEYSPF